MCVAQGFPPCVVEDSRGFALSSPPFEVLHDRSHETYDETWFNMAYGADPKTDSEVDTRWEITSHAAAKLGLQRALLSLVKKKKVMRVIRPDCENLDDLVRDACCIRSEEGELMGDRRALRRQAEGQVP